MYPNQVESRPSRKRLRENATDRIPELSWNCCWAGRCGFVDEFAPYVLDAHERMADYQSHFLAMIGDWTC
ncbi:hypothetical protein JOF41_003586 [Saccharothrix coeruleofusca]|nr:hypothetical protein [Saccharothrix coeruleofusca]